MNNNSITKVISLDEQFFHISILKYSNGYFISIAEEKEPSLGSVSLSIKTSNVVNTTIIIPSQFSPILPQLISELASDLSGGMGISSVYLTKELKPETAINLVKTIKSYTEKL